MSRLDIKTASKAQTVVDRLYKDMERRIASSPPGLCPIDMSLTFLQLCHAQSCGKCVPCRIGLGQLAALMGQVLDGTGTMLTIDTIEKTARAIVASADCAIGRDAAQLVLSGFEGFRDDYVNHVQHHRCLASLQNPVPCVSLCPAGVDVPGYVALVREGRYADAVRLIRKDNPMPTACAYICEHPCEARCRRNIIDDAVNHNVKIMTVQLLFINFELGKAADGIERSLVCHPDSGCRFGFIIFNRFAGITAYCHGAAVSPRRTGYIHKRAKSKYTECQQSEFHCFPAQKPFIRQV